jgi:hypothetical protein
MERNVGNSDSVLRILLGAVLGFASLGILAGAIETSTVFSPVLGVVALVLLVTGFTSTCGLYSVLGISTN